MLLFYYWRSICLYVKRHLIVDWNMWRNACLIEIRYNFVALGAFLQEVFGSTFFSGQGSTAPFYRFMLPYWPSFIKKKTQQKTSIKIKQGKITKQTRCCFKFVKSRILKCLLFIFHSGHRLWRLAKWRCSQVRHTRARLGTRDRSRRECGFTGRRCREPRGAFTHMRSRWRVGAPVPLAAFVISQQTNTNRWQTKIIMPWELIA